MVLYLHPHSASRNAQRLQGTLAQLVEQWTENPCVPGSIPGGTTKKPETLFRVFCFHIVNLRLLPSRIRLWQYCR